MPKQPDQEQELFTLPIDGQQHGAAGGSPQHQNCGHHPPFPAPGDLDDLETPLLIGGESYEFAAIENLDVFFTRCYRYWQERGLASAALSGLLNLAALAFTVAFSAFLLLCIDWPALHAACAGSGTTSGSRSCDILSVVLIRHPLASRGLVVDGLVLGYLAVFCAYWLWSAAHYLAEVRALREVRHFMANKLGISERQVCMMTWAEVLHRLVLVQRTTRLCIARDLDEQLIVSRIMRKDNYLIAMINQDVLNLHIALPTLESTLDAAGALGRRLGLPPWLRRGVRTAAAGGHRCLGGALALAGCGRGPPMLTKTLEWNLRWWLLDCMFDERFRLRPDFVADVGALRRRLRLVAVANLLLSPFLLVFLLIYFFLRNAERFYHHPGSIGSRRWSGLAKWRLREINELPHYLHHRLSASHAPAVHYIGQFPSHTLACVARFVCFITGSFVALLLLVTLLDESLLERPLMGRHIVWWLGTLTVALTISRSLISEDPVAHDPEAAMQAVAAHTHYLPRRWRGRGHTAEVQAAFSSMFQLQVVLFAQELASLITTPLVLFFSLPACADHVVEFVSSFTAHVEGVGDMCSMATFDLMRHGNAKYGAPLHAPKPLRSKQGKVEKSLLTFVATYTSWRPDEGAAAMLQALAAAKAGHAGAAGAAAAAAAAGGGAGQPAAGTGAAAPSSKPAPDDAGSGVGGGIGGMPASAWHPQHAAPLQNAVQQQPGAPSAAGYVPPASMPTGQPMPHAQGSTPHHLRPGYAPHHPDAPHAHAHMPHSNQHLRFGRSHGVQSLTSVSESEVLQSQLAGGVHPRRRPAVAAATGGHVGLPAGLHPADAAYQLVADDVAGGGSAGASVASSQFSNLASPYLHYYPTPMYAAAQQQQQLVLLPTGLGRYLPVSQAAAAAGEGRAVLSMPLVSPALHARRLVGAGSSAVAAQLHQQQQGGGAAAAAGGTGSGAGGGSVAEQLQRQLLQQQAWELATLQQEQQQVWDALQQRLQSLGLTPGAPDAAAAAPPPLPTQQQQHVASIAPGGGRRHGMPRGPHASPSAAQQSQQEGSAAGRGSGKGVVAQSPGGSCGDSASAVIEAAHVAAATASAPPAAPPASAAAAGGSSSGASSSSVSVVLVEAQARARGGSSGSSGRGLGQSRPSIGRSPLSASGTDSLMAGGNCSSAVAAAESGSMFLLDSDEDEAAASAHAAAAGGEDGCAAATNTGSHDMSLEHSGLMEGALPTHNMPKDAHNPAADGATASATLPAAAAAPSRQRSTPSHLDAPPSAMHHAPDLCGHAHALGAYAGDLALHDDLLGLGFLELEPAALQPLQQPFMEPLLLSEDEGFGLVPEPAPAAAGQHLRPRTQARQHGPSTDGTAQLGLMHAPSVSSRQPSLASAGSAQLQHAPPPGPSTEQPASATRPPQQQQLGGATLRSPLAGPLQQQPDALPWSPADDSVSAGAAPPWSPLIPVGQGQGQWHGEQPSYAAMPTQPTAMATYPWPPAEASAFGANHGANGRGTASAWLQQQPLLHNSIFGSSTAAVQAAPLPLAQGSWVYPHPHAHIHGVPGGVPAAAGAGSGSGSDLLPVNEGQELSARMLSGHALLQSLYEASEPSVQHRRQQAAANRSIAHTRGGASGPT